MPAPITVLGIGPEGPSGLGREARGQLEAAQVLAAGQRHLAAFPDWSGQTLPIEADLDGLIDDLARLSQSHRIAVLATGDPLFFGIGRRLLQHFPKEQLHFIPHLSSVQLAFARLKEPYDDAAIVSVHGRPLDRLSPVLDQHPPRIAVLTDPSHTPAAVARHALAHNGSSAYQITVCENLATEKERVTTWSLSDAAAAGDDAFARLNVAILHQPEEYREADDKSQSDEGATDAPATFGATSGKASPSTPAADSPLPLLGLPETRLAHRRGQITKQPVRLTALAELALSPGDCFWDIGAGSGAVALEAARLAHTLRVHAFERDPDACDDIRHNKRTLALSNVTLHPGRASQTLPNAPDPDAVFLGGSGGELNDLLEPALARLRPKGRLVVSCVTLETQAAAWQAVAAAGLAPAAVTVQIGRSQPIGPKHRLAPETPVTLVTTTKP
jgi:precorrin-6Y C5,15-methyltransferase (decarboxylating)